MAPSPSIRSFPLIGSVHWHTRDLHDLDQRNGRRDRLLMVPRTDEVEAVLDNRWELTQNHSVRVSSNILMGRIRKAAAVYLTFPVVDRLVG